MSDSLRPHGLYSPWNAPGQNTAVSSLSLLQGIFPTQGSNPGLPHCRQLLYQLSLKGSPRILEWVAYPFSSGSSWPRNRTRVSCIAGGFFTNWAIREFYCKLIVSQSVPGCQGLNVILDYINYSIMGRLTPLHLVPAKFCLGFCTQIMAGWQTAVDLGQVAKVEKGLELMVHWN